MFITQLSNLTGSRTKIGFYYPKKMSQFFFWCKSFAFDIGVNTPRSNVSPVRVLQLINNPRNNNNLNHHQNKHASLLHNHHRNNRKYY